MGAPLDALTAARLARDGEKPGPIRHMCSGAHTVFLLLSRMHGWDPVDYWEPSHLSQVLFRDTVARVFATTPGKLRTAIDGCGIETFAFPLREVARAYAMLADPSAIPSGDPRTDLAGSLTIVRDAMLANPELVGGRHDRLDTSLMKAAPGRLVAKGGAEALRGVGILPGSADGNQHRHGDRDGGHDRGRRRLRPRHMGRLGRGSSPGGGLDRGAVRELARYHRPAVHDPHGRLGAETIADFELAPVGELIG